MLKKAISILTLIMYLHGMSGYTMSIHKCMITGLENVYTAFGNQDPCEEEEKHCEETNTHFEQADCCDIQQTIVVVDDDFNTSSFQIYSDFAIIFSLPLFIKDEPRLTLSSLPLNGSGFIDPPDLPFIGVFRI